MQYQYQLEHLMYFLYIWQQLHQHLQEDIMHIGGKLIMVSDQKTSSIYKRSKRNIKSINGMRLKEQWRVEVGLKLPKDFSSRIECSSRTKRTCPLSLRVDTSREIERSSRLINRRLELGLEHRSLIRR